MYEHTKNVNAYYFGEIGVEADNEGDFSSYAPPVCQQITWSAGVLLRIHIPHPDRRGTP